MKTEYQMGYGDGLERAAMELDKLAERRKVQAQDVLLSGAERAYAATCCNIAEYQAREIRKLRKED